MPRPDPDPDPAGALALPDGLVARPVRLDDDKAAVILFNRCDGPFAGPTWHTEEETRIIWQNSDFDLQRDSLVVFDRENRLVAYQQSMSEAPYVRQRLFGRVDPALEGRGIGTTLFEWGERRARSRLDKAPADALIRMQAWCLAGQAPSRQLIVDQRMELIRHSLNMAMSLEETREEEKPVWPEGLELRPFSIDQLRPLYLAHREAFRDHSANAEPDVETGYERFRKYYELDTAQDPKFWYIAWDGDEIAGFNLCRPAAFEDPEMAWVDDLGVRRRWRRRGLARALLLHSIAVFRALGRPRIGLSVDAQSLTGATRLYESVGMSATVTVELYERQLRPGRDYETTSVD